MFQIVLAIPTKVRSGDESVIPVNITALPTQDIEPRAVTGVENVACGKTVELKYGNTYGIQSPGFPNEYGLNET